MKFLKDEKVCSRNKLSSIIEIMPGRDWQVRFVQDDTSRDSLGNKTKSIHNECSLSDNPLDVLSFDIISLETDTAGGMTL